MLNGWSNVLSALMEQMNMKYQSIPGLEREQYEADAKAAARARVEAFRKNLDERFTQAWTGKSEIQLEAEKGLIIEGKVNETGN